MRKKEIDFLVKESFKFTSDILLSSSCEDYSSKDLIIAIAVCYMCKRAKEIYGDNLDTLYLIEKISDIMLNGAW